MNVKILRTVRYLWRDPAGGSQLGVLVRRRYLVDELPNGDVHFPRRR